MYRPEESPQPFQALTKRAKFLPSFHDGLVSLPGFSETARHGLMSLLGSHETLFEA